MTYVSIRDDLRDALSVTSANDAILLAGVKRAARYLLRNFNFPESLVYFETTLAVDDQEVDLEFGTGKVLAARLKLVDASISPDPLYKVLARREHAVLPYEGGPASYWRTELGLKLDTAISEAGYTLQVWYQTVDLGVAESWLTCNYEDVMFHLSALRCCPLVHKPELMQTFAPLWSQDEAGLAVYLNELEWQGMDLRMGNNEPVVLNERYPASA